MAPSSMPSDTLVDLTLSRDPEVAGLVWITLDRPTHRNAWSDGMLASFQAALDWAEDTDAVRVVAITGRGRAFSAGGDLKAMRDRAGMFAGGPVQLRSRYIRGIQGVPRRLARFDKPVIAAINGAAIGAGLDLACMCDLRIAARGARLGSTFVKVGLVPGDGGAYLLARTIGLPRALELVMTGRVIDADAALGLGLVSQVVPGDQLAAAVRGLAAELAAVAPLAVRLTKSAAYRSWDQPLEVALDLAASYQAIAQHTKDHEEGVNAILERRDPEFEGR